MYARNIFLLPILTRSLGVNVYGLWSQLYALIELLTPLFLLRLPSAFTRFLAAEQDVEAIRSGFWTSFLGRKCRQKSLKLRPKLRCAALLRHCWDKSAFKIAFETLMGTTLVDFESI